MSEEGLARPEDHAQTVRAALDSEALPENEHWGQIVYAVAQPEDPRHWHELTERERMIFRTTGAEFLAGQRTPKPPVQQTPAKSPGRAKP